MLQFTKDQLNIFLLLYRTLCSTLIPEPILGRYHEQKKLPPIKTALLWLK